MNIFDLMLTPTPTPTPTRKRPQDYLEPGPLYPVPYPYLEHNAGLYRLAVGASRGSPTAISQVLRLPIEDKAYIWRLLDVWGLRELFCYCLDVERPDHAKD